LTEVFLLNRKASLFLIMLPVFCLCAVSVSAQGRRATAAAPATPAKPAGTPEAPSQKDAAQVPVEEADVAITATVTAKELRFEVVPNPTVEFPGKPRRDTVWEAERENLPGVVEPGVTYRNIGIRLKIVSRFADIDRIVAEALGEVPVTDEIQPPEKTAPTQPPNTQAPASTPQPNGGSPQ
jgi:hypothetical protein